MKATVKLSIIQRMQVLNSMDEYRNDLNGYNQKRFDLVLDKVKEKHNSFDSEEMIYIVQALRTYSKGLNGSEGLRKLADRVEQIRIEFQIKHLGHYITA